MLRVCKCCQKNLKYLNCVQFQQSLPQSFHKVFTKFSQSFHKVFTKFSHVECRMNCMHCVNINGFFGTRSLTFAPRLFFVVCFLQPRHFSTIMQASMHSASLVTIAGSNVALPFASHATTTLTPGIISARTFSSSSKYTVATNFFSFIS